MLLLLTLSKKLARKMEESLLENPVTSCDSYYAKSPDPLPQNRTYFANFKKSVSTIDSSVEVINFKKKKQFHLI